MEKHVKKEEKKPACFSNLPEGCISTILSLTSPRDACRSCLVSSLFKSAAESDSLWEKFLPSDYTEIISRSSSSSSTCCGINFSSKKELFCRLRVDPLLIDGGRKSFALEKISGKKCFMVGARDFHITWGQTPKYWSYRDFPGSRFAEVAELLAVCWLEFHGSLEIRLLSRKTMYSVYLVLKFAEATYGFDYLPAEAVIKVVGGAGCRNSGSVAPRRIYLLDPDHGRELHAAPHRVGLIRPRLGHILRLAPLMSSWEGQFPNERDDGWMETEMGHFYNDGGEEDCEGGEVQFSLTEINGRHWKAGLIIQGVEFRPKADKSTN